MNQRLPINNLIERLHKNWPEICSPETDLVIGIIRMNDLIHTRTVAALDSHHLSVSQFEVLSTLRSLTEPYQMTPKGLSEAILFSSGGMTKVLIALEERGYVRRVADDCDKRSKLVRLTKNGRLVVERAMLSVAAQDRANFDCEISKEHIIALRDQIMFTLDKMEASQNGLVD